MSFEALRQELDRWNSRGLRATLWWRDDDASRATPALGRLIALSNAYRTPVALAVVPAELHDDLADVVSRAPACTVLQHGFAHRNHEPEGERRSEFGEHRAMAARNADLRRGTSKLASTFGERFQPVLVPPWNRVASGVVPELPDQGFRGLSTFGPRRARCAAPGIVQANTHVDPIAWRADRAFIGEEVAALRLSEHLAARREGRVDADEATGLLTHHLVLDERGWRFVEALLAMTALHPAVDWLPASAVFGLADAPTSARSA